jgi:hypothetical protein
MGSVLALMTADSYVIQICLHVADQACFDRMRDFI